MLVIVWYISASGGYVNTAACPPGILTPCPEYSHPATQEGFLGNYRRNIYLPQEAVLSTENDDPPPPYTEYEPPNLNANVQPIIRHNEDPAQNTSNNRPLHQYVMGMQHVPTIIRHLEHPAHNTSHNSPRHQYVMRMQHLRPIIRHMQDHSHNTSHYWPQHQNVMRML